MNVAALLVGQAALRPEAPAIIHGSGRSTRGICFAELEERSARCAGFLSESGIGPGDHVLVFVPMSIDLYLALVALFRIGAVATFLDPSAGPPHIEQCCAMIRPAAMIAVSKAHLLRFTCSALRNIGRKFSVGWPVPGARRWEGGYAHATRPPILPRSPDDPALVTFTSGSTGVPKAVVRSHGFLAAQHAALHRAMELSPGQIDLSTLPIFTLANLASGVTTVIPDGDLRKPGFIKAAPILRQATEHRTTRIVASPAFLQRLLEYPDAAKAMQSFDRLYTGGAPVFPGLLQQLQQAIPAAKVVAVYGSTEAEPIAHIAWNEMSPDDIESMFTGRGLLAGLPVPEIQLRIIRDQWGTLLPAMTSHDLDGITRDVDQPGEIVVSGKHVVSGYLNGQGDAESKFRVDGQGWHRTGDAGYLDHRGRLWLLGRAQAKIEDRHGRVYPFAVECAASRIDGIRRSALIQHNGQRTLVIEPAPGAAKDLPSRAASQLNWASLDEVRLVARLPVDKRHNAKIDYAALRRLMEKSGMAFDRRN